MPQIIKGVIDPEVLAICKELRACRLMLGWSLAHMERLTGLNHTIMRTWEEGMVQPHLHNLRLWAGALGYKLTIDIEPKEES
jgi:transcriptional regulator with XRE-family HTH domain